MKNTWNATQRLSCVYPFIAGLCLAACTLGAQGAGTISFGSPSLNTTTGYVSVAVNWTGNTFTSSTVYAVLIDLYANGTGVCLDATATKNSIAAPFSSTDVMVSGTSLTISKNWVNLSANYSPL